MSETPFRLLRAFNDPELRKLARARSNVDRRAQLHFDDSTLQGRLVLALAEERAISIKEMLEAFEFFAATRKSLRATALADLCAGHGLTGILFAAFERRIERVTLIDRAIPKLHGRVWDATRRVAPWIEDKVRYVALNLRKAPDELDSGTAVVAVHACGSLTDLAIDIGLKVRGPLALLPCCHADSQSTAPAGLQRALGLDLAYDIDRSYRLENAGWNVRWSTIPEAITPKNRVLLAKPRRAATVRA